MQKSNKKSVKKKIFISWSGENSKEIAKELKNTLEKGIFGKSKLECFVSDVDISSGDDWWNKIKNELKECKLGIVCITKENIKAPWIFFESGAMVARDLKVIPLLTKCKFRSLNDTPISSKHMVDFDQEEKFKQMIKSINDDLSILEITEENLNVIASNQYRDLIKKLSPVLKKLDAMRFFSERYIYPRKIKNVNINTIYISAPMASIDSSEYYELRNFLLSIKQKLIDIGFTDVICPLFDNENYDKFEGNIKAAQENFVKLKQVDSMMVIYPRKTPSSVLVEIGYALALCKKTVIFYHESLPYILDNNGNGITHISPILYNDFDDIINTIESNGRQLFKFDEED